MNSFSGMAPAIILVRPQMGENIGAAARAMMNFGLSELRLVAPRDGWPNEKAYSMAAHATGILDKAAIYQDFNEAVADLHCVYATTARARELVKSVMTPREAMANVRKCPEMSLKSGILFGPERTGLTNEEVAVSDTLICIPTDAANASLNVAQSLVILAYEWFQAGHEPARAALATTSPKASPVKPPEDAPATREEIQGLFDHLEAALDATHFFKTAEKKVKMWKNIRSLFIRAQMNAQEVRTLRGVVRSLEEGR